MKKSILTVLSLASLSSAQPLVRPTSTGLVYMNSYQAFIQEPWATRVPQSTFCPFTATPPYLNFHRSELVNAPIGANLLNPWPCSWTLSVLGDNTYPLHITSSISFIELTWGYDHTNYDLRPEIVIDPCDIDLNGTFNVLDFMTFLNTPNYDWNTDGVFNVFDFNDFLNHCSGE